MGNDLDPVDKIVVDAMDDSSYPPRPATFSATATVRTLGNRRILFCAASRT